MVRAPLLLLLAIVVAATGATSCSQTDNVDQFCNPACQDPLAPYCHTSDAGDVCGSCHPAKREFAICDCPANQTVQNFAVYSSGFGSCVPIPLLGQACTGSPQCSASGSDGTYEGVCVGGICAACDPLANAETITCPGGTPCPGSSRPGQTMRCGSDGFWILGGQIDISDEVGKVAVASSSSSTSAAASIHPFLTLLIESLFSLLE